MSQFLVMTSPAKLYQCGSESRYGCEILHNLKLETKRKNILGANSYICRNYSGKTGSGCLLGKLEKGEHKT